MIEVMVYHKGNPVYRLHTDNMEEAKDWAVAQEKEGYQTELKEIEDDC